MNKNKKIYITIGIIILAVILLVVSKIQQKTNPSEEVLPTRDTENLEAYTNIEDFCTDLTASQEFDEKTREDAFYQECLSEYSL